MTALMVNFDRDLEQVGWIKGKRLRLVSGPNNARARIEPGWEPVYRVKRDGSSVEPAE